MNVIESYKTGIRNFIGADLHDAKLSNANLRNANLRDANLRDANLRNANLRGVNLRNANLSNAKLSDANLRNANLRGAHLRGANLSGVKIENTIFGLGNVPCIANIHQKLFEVVNPSNFNMGGWHKHNIGCGTTHCRAGWIIILSGEQGKALEDELETNAAAALIYAKSDPTLQRIPNWFASNREALDDIKKMAMV